MNANPRGHGPTEEYSFIRYLEAKRSVDARAFNTRVWAAFLTQLVALDQERLPVVEFGAGIGSMAERILGAAPDRAIEYTLIDQDAQLLEAAAERLQGASGKLQFVQAEATQWLSQVDESLQAQVFIAHAFVDLVKIPEFLGWLKPNLARGGLLYFPINFDGLTAFEPPIDPEWETGLIASYHASMDAGPEIAGRGGSQSGRKLIRGLVGQGFEIVEAGASDWLVVPQSGSYPADEAYFLLHILKFFENELSGHSAVDSVRLEEWLSKRRQQIAEGELIYLAHQLDVLARLA